MVLTLQDVQLFSIDAVGDNFTFSFVGIPRELICAQKLLANRITQNDNDLL